MKKKTNLIHTCTAAARHTAGLDTVASSWLSTSCRSVRVEGGAAAAARQSCPPPSSLQAHYSAQPVPESPYSISTVTFTLIYRSAGFQPIRSTSVPKLHLLASYPV